MAVGGVRGQGEGRARSYGWRASPRRIASASRWGARSPIPTRSSPSVGTARTGGADADRALEHAVQVGLVGESRSRPPSERGVRTLERAKERHVAEHHPPGGARGTRVALVPLVHDGRLDVEDLVRPALWHRGHAGVDGLGLEHEQLALVGALLGGVELEPAARSSCWRSAPARGSCSATTPTCSPSCGARCSTTSG